MLGSTEGLFAPGGSLSTLPSAMRRVAANPQRPINHNCFNSIKDVFRCRAGCVRQVLEFVGVFSIVVRRPASGRDRRGCLVRVALSCLALTVASTGLAGAQTVTPDLFSPN